MLQNARGVRKGNRMEKWESLMEMLKRQKSPKSSGGHDTVHDKSALSARTCPVRFTEDQHRKRPFILFFLFYT